MPRLLNAAIARTHSRLCVGLDPDPARAPRGVAHDPQGIVDYLRRVIDATADLACAYKPNLAFFEALGAREGAETLEATLRHIPTGVLTIADAKRGDIGHSSAMYARALFERSGFGAATVNPLMGADCVAPFLDYADRLSFLLCLTSNPGADDFLLHNGLYLQIARRAAEWNRAHGNVGLVVGATRPDSVAAIRAAAPTLPFLVPGVGTQGGEIDAIVRHGRDDQDEGLVFNVSRGILYAGTSASDYTDAARAAAQRYRDAINDVFDGA
jgi:orotidine-5'-phosphate decarboxylase